MTSEAGVLVQRHGHLSHILKNTFFLKTSLHWGIDQTKWVHSHDDQGRVYWNCEFHDPLGRGSSARAWWVNTSFQVMIKLLLFVGNLCVSEASKVLVYVIGMVGQLHGLLLWYFLNEFPSFLVLVFSFECDYMKNVFWYTLQTKFGWYIVILMSVRSFVRPSLPISNPLLL